MKKIKSILSLVILGVFSFAVTASVVAAEKEVAPSSQDATTHSAVASKVEVANPVEKEKKTTSARSLTRQEIRSMPILERPYRFGHFYGNTVRRRHGI